jgi:hypothetical protein
MRQLALGHGGEILHRQHGEIGVEAPGAQLQRGIAAGVVELDLGALGQLADDLIQGGGRGGGAAGTGVSFSTPSWAESSTLARMGMVLRRSTTLWTCANALIRIARSTVNFI